MMLGQRLVLWGVMLGSILLVVVLFLSTANSSYAKSTSDNLGVDSQSKTASENQPAGSGECEVSDKFPANIRQWCNLITTYASKHGLPADLIAALVWQESGGNPQAYSSDGAVGLMQVMPSDGIAASFQCQNGPCFRERPSTDALSDPEYNLAYGTRMLANLLKKYGSLREALKSYGPMNVGFYYADKVLGIYEQFRK